jgi:PilZ domain
VGITVAVATFLKQRAVTIAVDGQYTLGNWYDPQGKPRTFACRTNRISPFRMMIDVPVMGKVGDHLTSYFRDFGELIGCISDTRPGCFLLELEMTFSMRERFANKLVWLEEKLKDPAIPDLRKDARMIPAIPHSTLTLADGSVHECFVIDMSISGVAVSAQVQPEIGTPLAVGACVGRVVRVLPDGFAIQFIVPQHQQDLDRFIARPRPPPPSGSLRG